MQPSNQIQHFQQRQSFGGSALASGGSGQPEEGNPSSTLSSQTHQGTQIPQPCVGPIRARRTPRSVKRPCRPLLRRLCHRPFPPSFHSPPLFSDMVVILRREHLVAHIQNRGHRWHSRKRVSPEILQHDRRASRYSASAALINVHNDI